MSRYVGRARGKTGLLGAIYARFSSRFQHSIADQVRECRRWAEENGIEVRDGSIFVDERQSGRKSRRDGFNAMMAAVRAGDVDVVIIFVTSRLFRKTYKTLKFVEEEICDRRIRCVFVKSRIDTADKENWRKLLHVHGLVDEMTIQLQVAHIQAAHEGQLRAGIVFGTLTYGYTGEPCEGPKTKLGKPRRKLVIDPVTCVWVKQVFNWFNEGVSIREIAQRLNQAQAPLPQREQVRCWSSRMVRRMLDNPRYLGRWQYGATEAVWQNGPDYSRQFKREQPLAEMTFEHLRIIDEATWAEAQRKLLEYHRRAGRRAKRPDGKARPRVLSGLLVCEKHRDRELWVGGANGKYLFCPACREDPEPALVSLVNRRVATERLTQRIAGLLQDHAALVPLVIEACQRSAEAMLRPDPGVLDSKRREHARLTREIQFVLSAPGESQEDMAENQAKLLDLRRQRAQVAAEIQRLEEAIKRPIVLPTAEQVIAMLADCAQTLNEAAGSDEPKRVTAARRIVEAVTGGRIVVSQHGDPRSRKGWLAATFTPRLAQPILNQAGVVAEASRQPPITVELRRPTPAETLAAEAKALWDQSEPELLVKEIARKLSRRHDKAIGRNLVAEALAHWFGSRGLPVPDGRSRRSSLTRKSLDPSLYQKIADRVMQGWEAGRLLDEIAKDLDVDRNTVTAAVRYWHEQRRLPVPDGRTRRKSLDRKSRRQDVA